MSYEISKEAVQALDTIANEVPSGRIGRQIEAVIRSIKPIEEKKEDNKSAGK